MWAARKGETEAASLLVKAGASLDLQNKVSSCVSFIINSILNTDHVIRQSIRRNKISRQAV